MAVMAICDQHASMKRSTHALTLVPTRRAQDVMTLDGAFVDIGVGRASLDTEAAHYNSFEVGAKQFSRSPVLHIEAMENKCR